MDNPKPKTSKSKVNYHILNNLNGDLLLAYYSIFKLPLGSLIRPRKNKFSPHINFLALNAEKHI